MNGRNGGLSELTFGIRLLTLILICHLGSDLPGSLCSCHCTIGST